MKNKKSDTTIKVCVEGKKCRKRGGPELHEEIERCAAKEESAPRVKAVDCLGLCKHAPAVVVKPEGTEYGEVSTKDAAEIVSAASKGKEVDRLLVKKKKKKKK
ncbi:MAG: (2Fe-2S) ferredoxin domain-containing protein [Candidatus Obscuribacterales bacterium]|nr:(2Fe-2S) ferredoxin domain-containing protein [Candidatus Obscuribacterales bacterium]